MYDRTSLPFVFRHLILGAALMAFVGVPAAAAGRGQEESTIVAGLRDALAVGTENAVKLVSQPDGYFGNELIKILLPEKIRTVAETMGRLGMQKQVDEFVLSMNRAAEKAGPEALGIFIDAVRNMSIEDALGILDGEETAATEYFRIRTSESIHNAFSPIISDSMSEAGVTRAFKALMERTRSLPFIQIDPFDLDKYVTEKSIEGLFFMIGEEEKKIRSDPAARVTDLLKQVFK
jgi:uncharacterized protein DUF4197